MGESLTGGEFVNGGESAIGGESEILAHVDANRRRVLVQWLRDAGYGGCADDLEHEVAGTANAVASVVAYEIADHLTEVYDGDDRDALTWHLRDWADKHDKLGRE